MSVGTPGIGVYMAFGNKPTDNGYTFNTDITRYVRKIHYARGRQVTLNTIEAGTGDATLNDSTRVFDPNNLSSPYYPNVQPMKPIQMTASIGGSTYYLTTQFVQNWPRTRTGPNYAERNITTVDGFNLLSLFGLAGRNYGTQLSGALINNILSDAMWPTSLTNIGPGQSLIDSTGSGGTGFATTDTTKAMSYIQQVVGAGGENGLFFVDGKGRATFYDRHAQFGPPFNTSQATFTDVLTTPGEFLYTDIKPTSDIVLVYDDWIGQRALGSIQEAIDSVSISNYGRRTQTITSLLTTDVETLQSMEYSLSIYKNPLQRVNAITLKPGNNKELWQQCLSREIGDRITIKEHPPGTGGGLLTGPGTLTGGGVLTSAPSGQADIRDYTIQGIDATYTMGPVGSAIYTWSLFPASQGGFVLDDTTLGTLDVNALSY